MIAELRAMRALMEQQKPDRDEGRAAEGGPSQDVRRLKIELDVIGDAIKETRCEIVSLQDQGFDSIASRAWPGSSRRCSTTPRGRPNAF